VSRRLKSGVIIPQPSTFKRYGITEAHWLGLLASQGGVCPICARVPPSGKMAVDHEHVPKWKRLAPAERARFVRGVVCVWCNRWALHYSMSAVKAKRVAAYLADYQDRRDAWST
jgi:hypothetical protein